MAAPLTNLTKKGVVFEWGSECESSFVALKQALTTAPCLTVFDVQRETRVSCDASSTCVGGVLEQHCEDG